jgi:hypothetical protein
MSDVQQTETGADQNALRNNIPVGESRELKVAAVHQLADGSWVIAAWVSEDDVDTDHCTVEDGLRPAKGDMLKFTHRESTHDLFVTKA